MKRSVKIVGSRLGNDVDNGSSRLAEFSVKITGLDGDLLDCIGNVESLRSPGEGDVVIVGPIQEIIVPSWALPIDCKLRGLVADSVSCTAGRRYRPGQSARQRNWIEQHQWQAANV